MQLLEVSPQQIIVVGENNVRFRLLFTKGLAIVVDHEEIVLVVMVASLEVEIARPGVSLSQLPSADMLPHHRPAQGGQAMDILLHVPPQLQFLHGQLPRLLCRVQLINHRPCSSRCSRMEPTFLALQLLSAFATARNFWSKTRHELDAVTQPF